MKNGDELRLKFIWNGRRCGIDDGRHGGGEGVVDESVAAFDADRFARVDNQTLRSHDHRSESDPEHDRHARHQTADRPLSNNKSITFLLGRNFAF